MAIFFSSRVTNVQTLLLNDDDDDAQQFFKL